MKRTVLMLLSCTLSFLSVAAGEVIEKRYDFSEPRREKIELTVEKGRLPERFDFLAVTGCPVEGLPGHPALPRLPVRLLIPQGHGIDGIEVVPGPARRLPGTYRLAPSQPAFPLDGTSSLRPCCPDPDVYESRDPYPQTLYTQPRLLWTRGYCVAVLELFPVQLVPREGAAIFYSSLTLRIHTSKKAWPPGIRRCRGLAADLDRVERGTDNPQATVTYAGTGFKSQAPQMKGKPGDWLHPLEPVDYVIITNQALAEAATTPNFQTLIDHRTSQGLGCALVTVEKIYAQFPGETEAEKIRNFCIHAYENLGAEYVLLGGDGDQEGPGHVVPAKGFYATGEGYSTYNLRADLYYANLDGDFDYNQNNIFGEIGDGPGGGEVDLSAELYVGRAPVADEGELQRFVSKVLAYENSDPEDPVHERALFVGEFLWADPDTWGGDYMDELRAGSGLYGYESAGFPPTWTQQTLYERNVPWTASDLSALFNSNQWHLVNHLGHANTTVVMKLGLSKVDALVNTRPFFAYSQGCYAGNFSAGECMAERFVTAAGGAFGAIMNDQYGWGEVGCTDGSSQYLHRQFIDALFNEGIREAGAANADSKEDNAWCVDYKSNRWCLYETNLFGDPATPLLKAGSGSKGTITLDRTAYKDGGEALVTVRDKDLNDDPLRRETVQVHIEAAGGGSLDLSLVESGWNSPKFTGLLRIEEAPSGRDAGLLALRHGQAFTVTYIDDDDGFGHHGLPVSCQAVADFEAPLLSQVSLSQAEDDWVEVTWEANEPVTALLCYGLNDPNERTAWDSALTTHPAVQAHDLTQCSDYLFYVRSSDAAGNESVDDQGGLNYLFSTLQRAYVLDDCFNEDPRWSVSGGQWAFGPPKGMSDDPSKAWSGSNIYGYNLDGPYEPDMAQAHLTVGPLDLTGLSHTRLSFWRHLTIEGRHKDCAGLYLSLNGTQWTPLYENPISPYLEACWLPWTYDLSAADGHGAVYLRWTMGPTNGSIEHGGWNIDDVKVWGTAQPFGPWFEHASHGIDDLQGGNGDGRINPGEEIVLPVVVKNTGLNAPSLTAVLRAYPSDLFVTMPSGTFPAVAHNEEGSSQAPHFRIQPGFALEDGQEVLFELQWTGGGGSGVCRFADHVESAKVRVSGYHVDDGAFDHDGIPDPGETVRLEATIENSGSAAGLGLFAHITTTLPQYVTVLDPDVYYGDVPAGAFAAGPAGGFSLALSTDIPNYSEVEVTLSLSGANFQGQTSFTIEVTDCRPQLVFPLDADPGWTCEGDWAFGVPLGNAASKGCPDPTSGYTGAHVYGYNLEGGYGGSGLSKFNLTSLPVDCSGLEAVKLKFRRWLGVNAYDQAQFNVSLDGENWTQIWKSGVQEISDGEWVAVGYDLTGFADHQPFLYLRWTQGPFWSSESHCGWNIDDLEIWGR